MIKADPNVVRFRRLRVLYLACVILIAASMAALPALVAAKMGLPLYDLKTCRRGYFLQGEMQAVYFPERKLTTGSHEIN